MIVVRARTASWSGPIPGARCRDLAQAPEDLDPEDCVIQLRATLGLIEAVKAHELLESGSVTGKIAVTVCGCPVLASTC